MTQGLLIMCHCMSNMVENKKEKRKSHIINTKIFILADTIFPLQVQNRIDYQDSGI
ncbi:hypothetical protein OIU79_015322 [Salix purpurea]|uniref:Uncharacterized protein n=1 Tax=Salix purpurea TaxID=77065 RepID=A0A9Q0PBU4_SALPP|nr:hypothetical protein OIU79_015322 [Salix purpurea]